MRVSGKLIGTIWTLVLLGLTQIGFASGDRMGARERLLAMDDEMKPAQMEAMEPGGSNTGQQHDHGEMFIRTEKMMRGQIGVKRPAHATELAEERIVSSRQNSGSRKSKWQSGMRWLWRSGPDVSILPNRASSLFWTIKRPSPSASSTMSAI